MALGDRELHIRVRWVIDPLPLQQLQQTIGQIGRAPLGDLGAGGLQEALRRLQAELAAIGQTTPQTATVLRALGNVAQTAAEHLARAGDVSQQTGTAITAIGEEGSDALEAFRSGIAQAENVSRILGDHTRAVQIAEAALIRYARAGKVAERADLDRIDALRRLAGIEVIRPAGAIPEEAANRALELRVQRLLAMARAFTTRFATEAAQINLLPEAQQPQRLQDLVARQEAVWRGIQRRFRTLGVPVPQDIRLQFAIHLDPVEAFRRQLTSIEAAARITNDYTRALREANRAAWDLARAGIAIPPTDTARIERLRNTVAIMRRFEGEFRRTRVVGPDIPEAERTLISLRQRATTAIQTFLDLQQQGAPFRVVSAAATEAARAVALLSAEARRSGQDVNALLGAFSGTLPQITQRARGLGISLRELIADVNPVRVIAWGVAWFTVYRAINLVANALSALTVGAAQSFADFEARTLRLGAIIAALNPDVPFDRARRGAGQLLRSMEAMAPLFRGQQQDLENIVRSIVQWGLVTDLSSAKTREQVLIFANLLADVIELSGVANRSIQFLQEPRALAEFARGGPARPGAQVLQFLRALDPEFTKNIRNAERLGKTLEYVTSLLHGQRDALAASRDTLQQQLNIVSQFGRLFLRGFGETLTTPLRFVLRPVTRALDFLIQNQLTETVGRLLPGALFLPLLPSAIVAEIQARRAAPLRELLRQRLVDPARIFQEFATTETGLQQLFRAGQIGVAELIAGLEQLRQSIETDIRVASGEALDSLRQRLIAVTLALIEARRTARDLGRELQLRELRAGGRTTEAALLELQRDRTRFEEAFRGDPTRLRQVERTFAAETARLLRARIEDVAGIPQLAAKIQDTVRDLGDLIAAMRKVGATAEEIAAVRQRAETTVAQTVRTAIQGQIDAYFQLVDRVADAQLRLEAIQRERRAALVDVRLQVEAARSVARELALEHAPLPLTTFGAPVLSAQLALIEQRRQLAVGTTQASLRARMDALRQDIEGLNAIQPRTPAVVEQLIERYQELIRLNMQFVGEFQQASVRAGQAAAQAIIEAARTAEQEIRRITDLELDQTNRALSIIRSLRSLEVISPERQAELELPFRRRAAFLRGLREGRDFAPEELQQQIAFLQQLRGEVEAEVRGRTLPPQAAREIRAIVDELTQEIAGLMQSGSEGFNQLRAAEEAARMQFINAANAMADLAAQINADIDGFTQRLANLFAELFNLTADRSLFTTAATKQELSELVAFISGPFADQLMRVMLTLGHQAGVGLGKAILGAASEALGKIQLPSPQLQPPQSPKPSPPPSRLHGGPIPFTGVFLLHEGEFVLPRDVIERLGGYDAVDRLIREIRDLAPFTRETNFLSREGALRRRIQEMTDTFIPFSRSTPGTTPTLLYRLADPKNTAALVEIARTNPDVLKRISRPPDIPPSIGRRIGDIRTFVPPPSSFAYIPPGRVLQWGPQGPVEIRRGQIVIAANGTVWRIDEHGQGSVLTQEEFAAHGNRADVDLRPHPTHPVRTDQRSEAVPAQARSAQLHPSLGILARSRSVGGIGFRVTSAIRDDPVSLHSQGLALDIVPSDFRDWDLLVRALRAAGYKVLDERRRPAGSRKWTGPHIHVEPGMWSTFPQRSHGGPTGQGGLFLLHEGEFVVPRWAVERMGGEETLRSMLRVLGGPDIPRGAARREMRRGGIVDIPRSPLSTLVGLQGLPADILDFLFPQDIIDAVRGLTPAITAPRATLRLQRAILPDWAIAGGTGGWFEILSANRGEYATRISLLPLPRRVGASSAPHEMGHARTFQQVPTLFRGFLPDDIPPPDFTARRIILELLAEMYAIPRRGFKPGHLPRTIYFNLFSERPGRMQHAALLQLAERGLDIQDIYTLSEQNPRALLEHLLHISSIPRKIRERILDLPWVRSFSLPSRAHGGPIENTGPYLLHRGEWVLSERMVGGIERLVRLLDRLQVPSGAGPVVYNINGVNVTEALSPQARDEIRRLVREHSPQSILTASAERLAQRQLEKGYNVAL